MDAIDEGEGAWLPPRKTIDWRGDQVTEKEGIALKHLFDNAQNYFGQPDVKPNVTFNLNSLNEDSADETDRCSNSNKDIIAAASSPTWRGNLQFNYKMNSSKNRDTYQKLDHMSIDVCLDLSPKKDLNFGGHDLSEYCKTWVYVCAPRYTIETILRYFEAGTGFKASSKGLVLDEEQNIVHFEAKLLVAPQSEPGFWIANEDDGEELTRVGTIREASQDPANQLLFRCFGLFTVTAEVVRTSSSNPTAGVVGSEKEEARLTFTLINVRAEGTVNNTAPVVYDPRRCTKCNISDNPEWWD